MNYTIYLDNFRGIQNTYINLKDVNFLVGENSTGKTSFISILAILGEMVFWFSQEFNTKEINLGNFHDIVGLDSKDKDFTIGIIELEEDNSNSDKSTNLAIMMNFVEEKGLPIIRKYHILDEGHEVKYIFTNKQIKYKHRETSTDSSDEIIREFNKWITDPEKSQKGYKIFKGDIPYHRRRVLPLVGTISDKIIKGEGEISEYSFGFHIPDFAVRLAWIAPVRSKPKRTYDTLRIDFSSEGDHTPNLIKSLLNRKSKRNEFLNFLEEYGSDSGLYESIDVKKYGRDITAPFELDAIINEKRLNINNVGYGVPQVLPVIVELFVRSEGSWFAIQQPEIHLHPRAQASLGDIIFKLATEENKKFFIETHSDYIIDRFRINYKKSDDKPKIKSQILFFERIGNENKIYPIDILDDGNYSSDQPVSFRKFFIDEELRILGL